MIAGNGCEQHGPILEMVKQGIICADSGGTILQANAAAERLLGLKAGMSTGDLAAKLKGHVPGQLPWEVALSTGTRVQGAEIALGDLCLSVDAIAVGRDLFITFQDITDRKRAEAILMETGEQLRQSQKMEAIGRLAGGMAHDFNNLLGVILGYCDVTLQRPTDDAKLRGDLEGIRGAAQRAAELTRSLLAFSRRQVFELRPLDLNALVLDSTEMLRRLIGEDMELEVQVSPEPCPIMADPSQIGQIILNLVVNARDAMPTGGRLTIATRSGGADGDGCVELVVSDTGVGMDEDAQRKIFEPFFTTKPTGKGTGLGLSTVYGIVRQSGGTIRLKSAPGEGSAFSISLPRGRMSDVTQPAPVRSPKAIEGALDILLVEDEQTLRRLIARMLELCGHRVRSAANGREALDVCESGFKFDLLVVDVVMPSMSGPELASRIVAIRPEARVLFISGYNEEMTGRHGFLDGKAAFLEKPFTVSSLAAKVSEVIGDR